MANYKDLRNLHTHGYYHIDKKGRPIYIDQVEKMHAVPIFKRYTNEELIHYHV